MEKFAPITPSVVKVTPKDLHLAKSYYPILIELARNKRTLTYQELLQEAQQRHPDDHVIKKMRCVRSGRVLGVIYRFAEYQGLPRITTLIVKGAGTRSVKGECGIGVSNHLDCAAERQKCFEFDWDAHQSHFLDYISESQLSAATSAKKNTLTENQAENVYWAFYLANKARLIADVRQAVSLVVRELRQGIPAPIAFKPYFLG